MRISHHTLLAVALTALLYTPAIVHAVPITGFGPGGFEDDNGADNLVLWFRSDKGMFQDTAGTIPAVLNGAPVARWNDQSGYNRHMTTFGANPRAADLVLNQVNSSQSVVRVDNGTPGDGYTTPPSSLRAIFTQAQPITVYSTHAFRGGDAVNPTVWDGGGGNSMRLYGGGPTATSFNMYAGGAGATGAVGAVGSFHNLGVHYDGDGTPAPGNTFRTDGNQVASGGGGTSGAGGFSIGGGVWATTTPNAGQGADADFSEIFLFNRTLNATEQIIIDNYQSAHSGIAFAGAVAANDHYAGDNPGLGNYDFGVFGIGDNGTFEVDNAGMEGFGVEVGAGSLSGPNEWVFAGHTDGANGVTPPSAFGGQRWQRSWYLDTTNVGTADLAFDWQDAGNTATFDSAFNTLFFSATNGGPLSIVATGNVDIGNQSVTFLNVALQDGYYTLGSVGVPEPSTLSLLAIGFVGGALKLRRRRLRQ